MCCGACEETPPISACTNTEKFAVCVHSLPEVAPSLRLLCLLLLHLLNSTKSGSNKSTRRALQPISEVSQMCFCRLIFTLTSNYSACVAEADLKQLQPRLDKISLFIFLLLVVFLTLASSSKLRSPGFDSNCE